MGKGDKKTKRGKITIGSFGVRRPKKKKNKVIIPKKPEKQIVRETEEIKIQAPVLPPEPEQLKIELEEVRAEITPKKPAKKQGVKKDVGKDVKKNVVKDVEKDVKKDVEKSVGKVVEGEAKPKAVKSRKKTESKPEATAGEAKPE